MTLDPRVVETHSALLFSVGDRVYKTKKAVDLGFLDFTTREARRQVCEQEVALNRRLAPDVYLGVHDVVDETGRPYEHMVVMRRMPEERALSRLVLAGADVGDELRRLARLLAAFHASTATSAEIERTGSPAAVLHNWQTGLDQLHTFVGDPLDATTYERMRHLALRYLEGRARLLEQRRAAGCIRDGHGDLLAADIYCLDDGPRVLDCIEFDPSLRYGDVLLDVAFLAMDLEDLGRPDLAQRFLTAYEEFSGWSQPASLVGHYVAYRAQVRSKVTLMRWSQGDATAREHGLALADLAVRHLERTAVRLVLVGGLPGTGKSTVAGRLADARGWTLLRSDVLRKEQAGLDPGTHAAASYGQGLYTPQARSRTYEGLLSRARTALELGESVVLDASWSGEQWREQARAVARGTCSDLVELRCEVPAALAAERLRARAVAGGDPSDADVDVARAMAADFDPWPTAAALDTGGSVTETVERALAQLCERSGPPMRRPVTLPSSTTR